MALRARYLQGMLRVKNYSWSRLFPQRRALFIIQNKVRSSGPAHSVANFPMTRVDGVWSIWYCCLRHVPHSELAFHERLRRVTRNNDGNFSRYPGMRNVASVGSSGILVHGPISDFGVAGKTGQASIPFSSANELMNCLVSSAVRFSR
jgi:hypothetical protein